MWYGVLMDSTWSLRGVSVESPWSPHGVHVDSLWTPQSLRGLYGKPCVSVKYSLLPIISDVCDQKSATVGGMEKWGLLSDEEKAERDATAHEDIVIHLGQAEYEALP